jgi:hypothetical protein
MIVIAQQTDHALPLAMGLVNALSVVRNGRAVYIGNQNQPANGEG